jgi:hypothetical protein
MVMKVIQREVDAAKSSCDMIREQVVELLDEARGLLTGDIKVPDDTPLANVANTAAHKLLNGLSGVAALCATLRWHDSLINTMKASEPMESVAAALKDFAFMDACRLCESESPLHNAFDQAILEYAVDAAKFVGRTLAAFDKANEVCEKYGIDINKIQAGDKETLKTYVDAVAHMTGKPVDAKILALLGIGPSPAEGVANIAESLGLDPSKVTEISPGVYGANIGPAAEEEDKDTIRA